MSTKKPTLLKKMKGTYDKRTDKPLEGNLPMLPVEVTIEVPESITNEKVKETWKNTTDRLLHWGILSDIDLPELEEAFLVLQELKRINDLLVATSVEDESYSTILNNKLKSIKMFHDIMKNFGLSPVERSRLSLSITEIKKNESLLDKIQKGS